MADFNAKIIEEFRTHAGQVGGPFDGRPLLLLHHRGAKSGSERVNPVMYVTDGDRLVIVASKGGAPTNPDWLYNLRTHADAEVEVGTDRFPVTATELEGDERDRVWGKIKADWPQFAEYEAKATRTIPVVALERR